MGCFSYKCNECGKGVISDSFKGEKVKIFLLKKGQVLEMIEGEYNSYGAVFIDNTQVDSVKHALRESKDLQHPETEKLWDHMYDEDSPTDSGIAYVHSRCYKKDPTERSDRDPMQGWGEEGEYFCDDFPGEDSDQA